MLVIIECKTFGKEYDKAHKDTGFDGAQLFSYWQQERATKWLVLYSSDLDGEKIVYKAPTINCTDYKSVLESAQKDNNERISLKLKGMSPVQYRTHSLTT